LKSSGCGRDQDGVVTRIFPTARSSWSSQCSAYFGLCFPAVRVSGTSAHLCAACKCTTSTDNAEVGSEPGGGWQQQPTTSWAGACDDIFFH
jgi:hypothetical protein